MTLSKTVIVAIWLLCPVGTMSVHAEEQRCNELGANCVCSERFNTNALPKVSGSWYNPADSTTKECSTTNPSILGGAIERNASDLYGSNDSTVLGALPAGYNVSYFVRGPEGHLGIFFAGHKFGSQFVKRSAARYYIYHSPNYQFAQEGVCTNSKMAQFDGGALLDKSFGTVHMYNFTSWTPAQDCCFNGPGPDQMAVNKADWRGKWWRVEIVFTNRAGGNPGFVAKVYMKNVTDNGPELTVVDTSAPGTQLNTSNSLTPPVRMDKMHINNYRETGCKGWLGMSHYMAAGWDTDQGQRIGPAYEIEGGGNPTPTLSPPSNLKINL